MNFAGWRKVMALQNGIALVFTILLLQAQSESGIFKRYKDLYQPEKIDFVDYVTPPKQRQRFRQNDNANIKKRSPSARRNCSTKCTGNKTMFEYELDFPCHYDNACFEIFRDCCSDYQSCCGEQTTSVVPLLSLRCVKMGLLFNEGCKFIGPSGVWMIQTCPSTWPSDETKRKCHNPPERFSLPVEDYVPVVADNHFTYRNKHCAVCHGINNYTTWNIRVKTFVTPPAEYDINEKLRFILNNGGTFKYVGPMKGQARRYCIGENYVDSCANSSHFAYYECLNGPVEVVTSKRHKYYYKNTACALCNGDLWNIGWGIAAVCGDFPEGFSIVFNNRNSDSTPATRIISKHCPGGTVFDKILQFCRSAYITRAKDNLSNEFLVALWFGKSSIIHQLLARKSRLEVALIEGFHLNQGQISALKIHKQDRTSEYLVVSFRLTLTQYQDFILANQRNRNNMNVSKQSKEFLKLLNFTGNFTLRLKNYSLPIIKLVATQLACLNGIILKHGQYHLDKRSGRLFDNNTKKFYLLKDYSVLGRSEGNITICRKIVLADCVNGSYVPLNHDEYIILPDLSLYHNATNQTFEFGEYQINEAFNNANDSSNTTILDIKRNNKTVAICLPYSNSFNDLVVHQPGTNICLRILTLVGFCVSIMCLLLLLITYGMFKELRTLPGMNLMSLSFLLLLSHLLWLIGTTHFQTRTLCRVFAILEHYLFLASFFAMSAISYHSCLVFSRTFAPSKSSNYQRTFIKYSAVVWSCPAIFVVFCVILDTTEIFTINYGYQCWIGTEKAKLYLFLLPSGLLLLFNIVTFIRTALSLSRHKTETHVLQKETKQNLLVCTKLSTLVGFPWIIAFFGIIFPHVEAFDYLFVIFVTLQGFYIGVAFLCNKKTFNLYKNFWSQGSKPTVGFSGRQIPTASIELSTR